MKKTRVISLLLGAVILVIVGIFIWLLQGASPQAANPQEVVVEVPDTFEK